MKRLYIHCGTETLNKCDDDFQLMSTPIQNSLYVPQNLFTLSMAAISHVSITTSLKLYYMRLGYSNYTNLKRLVTLEELT